MTHKSLPENIQNILSKGLHQPVGGRTNKNIILTKFECFFNSWHAYALKQRLDIFKITKIRSQLFLEFCKFVNCTTKTRSDELKKYLDSEPELLICPSDKTKNINIISHTSYLQKLDEVFCNDKFKKLKINPINTDLTSFRKLINSFSPYLSNKDDYKIKPIENLKRGYGIIKNHKNNLPLRPIVASINSITSGVEEYLKELISPINKACKFSVDSTLSFKTKFVEFTNSGRFNSEEYEIVSYDCQSLYTSININRVLNFILNFIYADTSLFFPPKTKTVKILREVLTKQVLIPPRETLKNFFHAIFTKFSTFQALNGFFRQINGVSMGGKLSPSIANIFCHMFELDIIQTEINKGNIQAYFRYVDDILVVIKKGQKHLLLEKLNKFDKNLGFTTDSMINNKLTFLDTSVILKDGSLFLEHFRKPSATDCLTNFKTGVSPKSYKISSFVGEIYRCHHSTTTVEARERAIEQSKKIFLKNKFPRSLLEQKISEVRNRDFRPSNRKEKRKEDLENPDFEHHTMSITYTSFRCSRVASNIYKILKQFTPNYKLRIVFSTIRLDSVIHPRLKPTKPYYHNSNINYRYICDCGGRYIGETQQLLHTRVKKHRTDKNSHIFKHILTCSQYQQTFYNLYGIDQDNATDREKLEFFESHFTIAEKNLLNKHTRKVCEGMLICLERPSINVQKEHTILNFICPCFLCKIEDTSIT